MFIMHSETIEPLEVFVTKHGQLYGLLNDAEAVLRQAAMVHRSAGVLVTRINPVRYTLSLSDLVPFGETWERSLP